MSTVSAERTSAAYPFFEVLNALWFLLKLGEHLQWGLLAKDEQEVWSNACHIRYVPSLPFAAAYGFSFYFSVRSLNHGT